MEKRKHYMEVHKCRLRLKPLLFLFHTGTKKDMERIYKTTIRLSAHARCLLTKSAAEERKPTTSGELHVAAFDCKNGSIRPQIYFGHTMDSDKVSIHQLISNNWLCLYFCD